MTGWGWLEGGLGDDVGVAWGAFGFALGRLWALGPLGPRARARVARPPLPAEGVRGSRHPSFLPPSRPAPPIPLDAVPPPLPSRSPPRVATPQPPKASAAPRAPPFP